MFGIKRRFQRCKVDPLGSRRPPYERIKFGYALKTCDFCYCRLISREWLQIDTDLLRIITSTADEVSKGTNIDDLEWRSSSSGACRRRSRCHKYSRHADLSWARRFAVASPRFIGRRSASTVLSQDCLGRPALRLQSPGEWRWTPKIGVFSDFF